MPVGAFVRKQHQPAMREVFASIASRKGLWGDLEKFVAENFRTKRDFVFYGKNHGWALRFRKAGEALLSMYPGEGVLTVQIVLAETLQRKQSI
jgi:hypothetical protein